MDEIQTDLLDACGLYVVFTIKAGRNEAFLAKSDT